MKLNIAQCEANRKLFAYGLFAYGRICAISYSSDTSVNLSPMPALRYTFLSRVTNTPSTPSVALTSAKPGSSPSKKAVVEKPSPSTALPATIVTCRSSLSAGKPVRTSNK